MLACCFYQGQFLQIRAPRLGEGSTPLALTLDLGLGSGYFDLKPLHEKVSGSDHVHFSVGFTTSECCLHACSPSPIGPMFHSTLLSLPAEGTDVTQARAGSGCVTIQFFALFPRPGTSKVPTGRGPAVHHPSPRMRSPMGKDSEPPTLSLLERLRPSEEGKEKSPVL